MTASSPTPPEPGASRPSVSEPGASRPSVSEPAVSEPGLILHMAPARRWEDARSSAEQLYVDPSLDNEGFIHCSTVEQLLIPANERFVGRADLVVLVIDVEAVDAPVVFEDCYDGGQAFPHVYGPIPVTAVKRTVLFPCDADGRFALPDELVDLRS